MILRARGRTVAFPRRPLVMGILNLDDDSFSDDGSLDLGWAAARTRELVAQGADIIDVGAESARTNRARDPEAEGDRPTRGRIFERFARPTAAPRRRRRKQIFPPLLSVNTWRPAVARAALAAAATSSTTSAACPPTRTRDLRRDRRGAAHHAQRRRAEGAAHARRATPTSWRELDASSPKRSRSPSPPACPREAIVLDPGIDFAKQRATTCACCARRARLRRIRPPDPAPHLAQVRDRRVLGLPDPRARDAGTVACLAAGTTARRGIFRVHNVRAARTGRAGTRKPCSPHEKSLAVSPAGRPARRAASFFTRAW